MDSNYKEYITAFVSKNGYRETEDIKKAVDGSLPVELLNSMDTLSALNIGTLAYVNLLDELVSRNTLVGILDKKVAQDCGELTESIHCDSFANHSIGSAKKWHRKITDFHRCNKDLALVFKTLGEEKADEFSKRAEIQYSIFMKCFVDEFNLIKEVFSIYNGKCIFTGTGDPNYKEKIKEIEEEMAEGK